MMPRMYFDTAFFGMPKVGEQVFVKAFEADRALTFGDTAECQTAQPDVTLHVEVVERTADMLKVRVLAVGA